MVEEEFVKQENLNKLSSKLKSISNKIKTINKMTHLLVVSTIVIFTLFFSHDHRC